jgi:hypothetical protein
MVRNLSLDQRGGTMVYVLVGMVVLSLTIIGMLQMALASYQTGRFMEQRRQALAAAESGVALAVAELNSGAAIDRASYSNTSAPSIDSAADGWIGLGSGSMPPELSLGRGTSFRVWVGEPVGSRTQVVAEGRSGGRIRLVQVTLKPKASDIRYLVSAMSERSGSIGLRGNQTVNGEMYTRGLVSDTVDIHGNFSGNANLYVRPSSDLEGIRRNVGSRFKSVSVDPEEYVYPLATPPAGLTNRGKLKLSGNGKETIRHSGQYSSIDVTGNYDMVIDATAGDIIVHVTGNFELGGNSELIIEGDHAFRLYVDGNVKWHGNTHIGMIDPSQFIICCGGSVELKGNQRLNAVVYAPNSSVVFNGNARFTGAVVAQTMESKGNDTLTFPSGAYADKIRDLNFGGSNSPSIIEVGSWSELRRGED